MTERCDCYGEIDGKPDWRCCREPGHDLPHSPSESPRRVRITGGPSPRDVRVVDVGSGVDITSAVQAIEFEKLTGEKLIEVNLQTFADLDVVADVLPSRTGSDAVLAFAAWLTTRPSDELRLLHDSSVALDLAHRFWQAHKRGGLEMPIAEPAQ